MTSREPTGIVWRTSSYSSNGEACVEVGWHKSSHSSNGGACVEVRTDAEDVLVRDTKNRTGPMLAFPAARWIAFLTERR